MNNNGIGYGIDLDFNLGGFVTHQVTIVMGNNRVHKYKATCMKDEVDDEDNTTLYKVVKGEKDYSNYIEISDDESVTICNNGEYIFADILDIDIDGGDVSIECEDVNDNIISIQCKLLLDTEDSNFKDIMKITTFDLDGNELDDPDEDWDEDDDNDWDEDDDDDWDEDDDDEYNSKGYVKVFREQSPLDNKIYSSVLRIESGSSTILKQEYYGHNEINEVIIPEGVHTIKREAFAYCSNLTNVIFPSSLKKIMPGAFEGCVKLSNIVLPEGLKDIGDSAFAFCKSITQISIPHTVKNIGERAFEDCVNLSQIHLSEGVESFGHNAFAGCGEIDEFIVPSTIEWIGDRPFDGCSLLNKLTFAERTTTCYCNPYRGLNGPFVINIPGSCTYISTPYVLSLLDVQQINIDSRNHTYQMIDGVLYDIRKNQVVHCLKNNIVVKIKDGVTSIGEYAFARCVNLGTIKLPSTLYKIDETAFQTCKKLRLVEAPTSTTYELALKYFRNKKNITVKRI